RSEDRTMPTDTTRPFAGCHLIEGRWVGSAKTTRSTPWKGDGHEVHIAEASEVDAAAFAAKEAFEVLYATDGETRAALLDRIAAEIGARGARITAIGHAETALPEARLEGERTRTCAQLRMFATYLRDGRHLEARTEAADPMPPRRAPTCTWRCAPSVLSPCSVRPTSRSPSRSRAGTSPRPSPRAAP
ncbi:MAG: aldehyde dehydrogenase family protein, partial [Pseudomonadota bacterium]